MDMETESNLTDTEAYQLSEQEHPNPQSRETDSDHWWRGDDLEEDRAWSTQQNLYDDGEDADLL